MIITNVTNVINVINVCCSTSADVAIDVRKVMTLNVFQCTFNMSHQDDDQFLELVPLSDVSDDVAARRVRTAVQNKDVRPLILQRRKEGTEINKIIDYNLKEG